MSLGDNCKDLFEQRDESEVRLGKPSARGHFAGVLAVVVDVEENVSAGRDLKM